MTAKIIPMPKRKPEPDMWWEAQLRNAAKGLGMQFPPRSIDDLWPAVPGPRHPVVWPYPDSEDTADV